jgi:glycosyltransferase involved in cell wall biosynthesis
MTKLRVVVTVDPYIPVPPLQYGGIERVVAFVVNGLVQRGHQVTLIAHPESQCAATLVGYGVPPHFTRLSRAQELWQVSAALLKNVGSVDAVLSWGRLAALLPVLPRRRLAKIQRYCRPSVPWRSVNVASRLAGSSIVFAAASSQVYLKEPNRAREGRWVTIHDGVELRKFQSVSSVANDAPLAFLGALEALKGVHHAIAIAKGSGRRLVIAGNRVEMGSNVGYFEAALAPHLDGVQIRYVGPVDDIQKSALLGQCAAFLMPTEWEETFGIVMAEAMACGTPVIAFDRGSVPEVVREGINGFRCQSVEDAILAVSKLDRIDRAAVRADCEARFSSELIIDAYESLLGELVRECRAN